MSEPTHAFICPVCREALPVMTPEETKNAPAPLFWEPPGLDVVQTAVAYAIAQNMQANEGMILNHIEIQHTIKQVMLAFGPARAALQEIRDAAPQHDWEGWLGPIVARGLGEEA